MLISFDEKINKIGYEEVKNSPFTIGLLSSDEFKNNYPKLGISTREYICFDLTDSSFRSSVTINSDSFVFPVKIISSSADDDSESQICFFLRNDTVFAVIIRDDNSIFRNAFYESVNGFEKDAISTERFIGRLFNRLTENDGKMNERTENAINELEENVIEYGRYTNVNEQILMYNKKLMSLRNYYEQLINIGERLYENENGIFDDRKTYYFKTVSDRAGRLCAEINLFRENLVRLREAYQARLDLKMNSTMKLLTVITMLFLPLTLITGWYGMNFVNMPELSSPFGYPAVIGVSIAVVLICIVVFRKKKLF